MHFALEEMLQNANMHAAATLRMTANDLLTGAPSERGARALAVASG
jgi:hypothetical protein